MLAIYDGLRNLAEKGVQFLEIVFVFLCKLCPAMIQHNLNGHAYYLFEAYREDHHDASPD